MTDAAADDRRIADALTAIALARGRGDPGGSTAATSDRARQGRPLAGHGRRRSRRSRHPARAWRGCCPALPVVSEEAAATGAPARAGSDFILVDPLDGTREFLAGRDEYTVNIALVRDGVPVVGRRRGAGARPDLARRCRDAPSGCAFVRRRRSRERGRDPHPRLAGRSASRRSAARISMPATAAFLDALRAGRRRSSCGSALKFCRLAEGAADIYPRLAPTSRMGHRGGPRAGRCRRRRGDGAGRRRAALRAQRRISACPASSPGAIRQRRANPLASTRRVRSARRPSAPRPPRSRASGSAMKAARASACRRDRAARRDTTQSSGCPAVDDAARDADRIVAAEARHIDVRIGREGRAVAFVVEAPDRAGEAVVRTPAGRRPACGR